MNTAFHVGKVCRPGTRGHESWAGDLTEARLLVLIGRNFSSLEGTSLLPKMLSRSHSFKTNSLGTCWPSARKEHVISWGVGVQPSNHTQKGCRAPGGRGVSSRGEVTEGHVELPTWGH